MQIKKIDVFGLGPLESKSISFPEQGLNFVLGPNESGKSTLCEAIVSIIFGFSSPREAQARRKTGSDEYGGILVFNGKEGEIRIARNFEDDHTSVTLLLEEGKNEILYSGFANPRGKTEEADAYRTLLFNRLKFPGESVFRNSSYVAQMDVEIKLSEELRRQISGAGQADYKKARELLRGQYYAQSKYPLPGDRRRAKDQAIEILDLEILDLQQELAHAKKAARDIGDQEERLHNFEAEKGEVEHEYTRLAAEHSALEKYLDHLTKLETHHTQQQVSEHHAAQLKTLQSEVERLNTEISHANFALFTTLSPENLVDLKRYLHSDVEQSLENIRDLEAQAKGIQAQLAEARFLPFQDAPPETGERLKTLHQFRKRAQDQAKQATFENQKAATPARRALWLIPLALFIIFGILGAVLGGLMVPVLGLSFNTSAGILIGGLLFGIPGVFLGSILAMWLQARPGGKTEGQIAAASKNEDLLEEIEAVEGDLSKVLERAGNEESLAVLIERWEGMQRQQTQLQEIKNQLAFHENREVVQLRENPQLKPAIEAEPIPVLRERLARFENIAGDIRTKQHTLKGLRQGTEDKIDREMLAKIEATAQEAQLLIQSLEKKYPTFQQYKADQIPGLAHLQNLKQQSTELETQRSFLERQIQLTRESIARMQGARYGDPFQLEEELQQKEESLARKRKQVDALQIAVTTLDEAIQEYEEAHIERLARQTSTYFSRFTRGKYPEVMILPGETVQVREISGQIFESSALSMGARDQLFLAVRLAVTDALSSEVRLPLLLDDAFVNFDRERLAQAQNILSDIAQERQILLLSHDDRLQAWTDHVISLLDEGG